MKKIILLNIVLLACLLMVGCGLGGGGGDDNNSGHITTGDNGGDTGGGNNGGNTGGNNGGGNGDETGSDVGAIPDNLRGEWLYVDSGEKIQLKSDSTLNYEKIDDNLLKVTDSEGIIRYLMRSGSNSVHVRGLIARLSGTDSSSKADRRSARGIGNINVQLRHLRDEDLSQTTTTEDDGSFDTPEVVSGDYDVLIEDDQGNSVETTGVTIEGEEIDLGVFTITGEGIYNIKTELILSTEYLYDNQTYTGSVRIHNVGNLDGLGLSYRINSDNTNLKDFQYEDILGTVQQNKL